MNLRALRPVGAATAVIIAVGLLQYAQPDRAAADDGDSAAEKVLALDALPGSPVPTESPAVPEGEFPAPSPLPEEVKTTTDPAPMGTADLSGGSVDTSGLKVVDRTEVSTTFERADGSRVRRISSSPINVKNGDGKWVDVNTSLSEADGVWRVKDHPLSPKFGKGADKNNAVSVSRDGHEVSFSLVGAGAGRAETPFWFWDDHEKFAFRDVGAGQDLEYEIQKGQVKESLVLAKAPGKGKNSWSWRLDAGDLTPRLDEKSNAVELVDADDTVVLLIPSPVAFDSAPQTGKSGPSVSALTASVKAEGKGVWRFPTSDPRLPKTQSYSHVAK